MPVLLARRADLSQLEKHYGSELRVVWKNNPLPFHQNAMPAAKAAMAAEEQGKFWEMHDKLFANQPHLDPATSRSTRRSSASTWPSSRRRYDPNIDAEIKADQARAASFGAHGTPDFFINGRQLRGAQPKESFKAIIDKEITAADALLKKGVKPAELYTELTKNGKDKAEGPAPQAARPGQPDPNTVYRALVEDAPVRGADARHAKVTIVEWSDFQCPFCGRVEPTLAQIMQNYGKDVRIAFKELPLPFHQYAHTAAEAALAAKAQGKFWEMHDLMFKNQQALDRASLEKYAAQIGLNVEKFKADLDSHKWKEKVDAEMKEGNKIGANGTPNFFINGKNFVGAQPYEAFKTKVEDAIKDAEEHAHGGNYAKYYDELMKTAKAEVAQAPSAGAPAADNKIYKVDAGDAPSKGPRSAPIQIVEFSDYQCPFCGRVEPTIKQIEEKYGDKIHFAFRNFPLPFHNFAEGAAEAAMAAKAQGKFWEMHDKMFANQQALDRASLEKYAGEIGLDMGKFKADLDSGKYKDEINKDIAYAKTVNVNGTPAFFINGHFINGAMPFESFAQVIDGELQKKHK